MLTPEGPPPYTAPVRPLEMDAIDKGIPHHITSMPDKLYCDNYVNSMLYIGEDLGQLHIQEKPKNPSVLAINVPGGTTGSGGDSSPDITQANQALKQGWMDGIFGCLRPMLSMFGKGGVNEIKGSQDDWEIRFESISIMKYLGSGGQGQVNLGYLNNELVAVKKVAEEKDTDIRHLRKLDHKNIIRFKGVCTRAPFYAIVMEYCPHGSLYDILKCEDKVVTPAGIVSWAKQIASGMAYVHSHKIIHRDLKSLNILIGENEIIKISDFGTSRVWNGVSVTMSFNGTVAWMAPEALREDPCSEKVDVWSFGIVLWELLTREPPFRDLEQNSIIFLVGSGKLRPKIPSTCPEGFKLIMQMCWKYVPKERPSFKLIANHLDIAAVEILSKYKEEQFYKTQESWKPEITKHLTQFKLKQREYELKEFSGRLWQKEWKQRKRESRAKEMQRKGKLMAPLMRKFERRRYSQNGQTTPTSPEFSSTSPDSPQMVPTKAPLYAQLNASSQPESVAMMTAQPYVGKSSRRKHTRTNSSSPRMSACSCSSSNRTSVLVDTETQTDQMDLSEIDGYISLGTLTQLNPRTQRAILHEIRDCSDGENCNGNNAVQIHYVGEDTRPEIHVFTRMDPRAVSKRAADDTTNQNVRRTNRPTADDDNFVTISGELATIGDNGNFSSDNGNAKADESDAMRLRTDVDSTEECCPNDSFTDDEGDVNYYNHLRRRSLARRPIYPGRRRSTRFKYALNEHRAETNVSDEGNTSEYSNSPSSKSSTLESNPDRIRSLAMKRTNNNHSDGSSDSESEDIMPTATSEQEQSQQCIESIAYDDDRVVNKSESVV